MSCTSDSRPPPARDRRGADRSLKLELLLSDTDLAAALVGVDASRYSAPDQGAIAGMLFETFVLMELVEQATWSTTPVELFFYRDTDKREVDLVIESTSGDIVGIEAKAAASAGAPDTRGLRLLRDKLGPRFKIGLDDRFAASRIERQVRPIKPRAPKRMLEAIAQVPVHGG